MTPPVSMTAGTITIRPEKRGVWRRARAAFGLLFWGGCDLGPSEVVLTNPEWISVKPRAAPPEAPAAPKGNSP